LGAVGSEQGRDIVAWREGGRWVFQCERVRNFYPADAEAEVDKALGLPDELRPVAADDIRSMFNVISTHGSDGVHTSALAATFDDGADSSYHRRGRVALPGRQHSGS
jgi:hypothetical protein